MQSSDYTTDSERLAALDRYGILDTPAEQEFDDIASLAAQICDAPVALVSLVAADRQWFKARVGFEPCETDLDRSVCAFALVEPDLLVIPDLSLDDRTKANPLVTGEPFIRFYAGAPLRAPDGHVIGSLCVIDDKPRPGGLSERQSASLRILARQVMGQLELRRAIAERDAAIALQQVYDRSQRESEAQYRGLFQAIDDGFCVVEVRFDEGRPVDYRFLEINPAFAAQTGLRDAVGKWMRDLAPGHEQYWFDIYGGVATTGEPVRFEHRAEHLDNRWFEVHAFRVGSPSDRRVAILFRDESDKKNAELVKQRADALQEIRNLELSHRMKNAFAMVQAIASRTLRGIDDRGAVAAFTQRIIALSHAHDVLMSNNWATAQLSEIVAAVLDTAFGDRSYQVAGPDVTLGAQATLSASLLLHELATNAIKYGALAASDGQVRISWTIEEDGDEAQLVLSWRERGGPAVTAPTRTGFGSKLISMGLIGTGQVDLRYLASGLEADFRAPLAQVREA